MKLIVGMALALLIAIPLLLVAQEKHSPYAGQEVRNIKSLSDAEVQGYLQGRGMGLAKPAELNRLFGDSRANTTNLQQMVGETARLQGELRLSHLRAHLEMRSILTQQQITRYNELRGHGTNTQEAPRHRHRY